MGELHRPERRALGVGGHLSQRRKQIVCTTVSSAERLGDRRRKHPPSFIRERHHAVPIPIHRRYRF